MAARKGFFTPKTYFPKRGDVLDDEEEGMSFQVMRNHTFEDSRSGKPVKYALLVGRHEEFGDDPIPLLVDSTQDMKRWLSRFVCIHRITGATRRVYVRDVRGIFTESETHAL